MDDIGYVVGNKYQQRENIIYRKLHPGLKATLAMELLTRWAIVAGHPDGESTDGRQRLRLLTPKELVDRATETADLAIDEMIEREWFLELPAPPQDKD